MTEKRMDTGRMAETKEGGNEKSVRGVRLAYQYLKNKHGDLFPICYNTFKNLAKSNSIPHFFQATKHSTKWFYKSALDKWFANSLWYDKANPKEIEEVQRSA